MLPTRATLPLSILVLSLGCGHEEAGPICTEIGEVCHDATSELGIECHEYAHEEGRTEDECSERRDECLAECQK